MDYLNIAQDLEQYGIMYFEVSNKKVRPTVMQRVAAVGGWGCLVPPLCNPSDDE